jgi:hypothetical protein
MRTRSLEATQTSSGRVGQILESSSAAGTAALRRVPDGFEGAPLGWWCPVCGDAVTEEELPLTLVEACRSGRDAVRWLMPVHRACCAWAERAWAESW